MSKNNVEFYSGVYELNTNVYIEIYEFAVNIVLFANSETKLTKEAGRVCGV